MKASLRYTFISIKMKKVKILTLNFHDAVKLIHLYTTVEL